MKSRHPLLSSVIFALGLATPMASATMLTGTTPWPVIFKAELVLAQMDPEFEEQVDRGTIILDRTRKQALLVLHRQPDCASPRGCARLLPEPIEIELPLVKVGTDACGRRTYKAQRDDRPVDGNLEVVEIRDNTQATCETAEEQHETEVTYVRVTAGYGSPVQMIRSRLLGGRLVRSFNTEEVEESSK